MKRILFLALVFALTACSTAPEPLQYGSDMCSFCKMTITDKRFGAEIVTKKGKVYKYDATECMLKGVRSGEPKEADIAKYLVVDASRPTVLTDAKTACYLISPNLRSPMGENICAFGSKDSCQEAQKDFGGAMYRWTDLKHLIKS